MTKALSSSNRPLIHGRDAADLADTTMSPTATKRQPAIVIHTGPQTGECPTTSRRARRHIQEPQQGINESFEDFQLRHFQARDGVGSVPADEGRPPPKSWMDTLLEIAFSIATLPGIEPFGGLTEGELPPVTTAPTKSLSSIGDAFTQPAGKGRLAMGDSFWGFLSKKNPVQAQEIALRKSESSSITYNTGIKNAHGSEITKTEVYRGYVFRGDMRAPEEVFKNGFELRTPVNSLEEVSGHRGGFGGGHDALDPDGHGISTSAYYEKDKAGAFYYGGAKGGTTYLIDARQMIGFDLYANNTLARNPGNTLKLPPLEINYAQDIPGSQIVGAFDAQGEFTANTGYKPSKKPIPFTIKPAAH